MEEKKIRLQEFDITTNPEGFGKVIIDGVDQTAGVSSVGIEIEPGFIPEVTITQRAGALRFRGEGLKKTLYNNCEYGGGKGGHDSKKDFKLPVFAFLAGFFGSALGYILFRFVIFP